MISFSNTYATLPSAFFSPISDKNSFRPDLIVFNHSLASELGIDLNELSDKKLAEYFSATDFMPGTGPVAMAYAGHQFGHFVPQLGDGRAMLLGEFLDKNCVRYDVHLKGSGRTFYSRRGDGRSAIGPVLREFLLSESMQALGIPTTRSLCAVRTGEMVQREEMLPGAVLTRLARAHIRVGTFQFFAAKGDVENLNILTKYSIERLYPELKETEDSVFKFWHAVCSRQVKLISQWMSVGFIHGVMNTDNMSVSGETIDYGPCAFMDQFTFNKVFSSIDQNGRYSYGNQLQIAVWNFARLAECLIPLMGEDEEKSKERLEAELSVFQETMMKEYFTIMSKKLGIEFNVETVKSWNVFLERHQLDFTLSYIDLERILGNKKTFTDLETLEGFREFSAQWKESLKDDSIALMKKCNPQTIPRNHMVEKVIRAAEAGDDQPFIIMVENIKKPFERLNDLTPYQLPPRAEETVHRTFCGT